MTTISTVRVYAIRAVFYSSDEFPMNLKYSELEEKDVFILMIRKIAQFSISEKNKGWFNEALCRIVKLEERRNQE